MNFDKAYKRIHETKCNQYFESAQNVVNSGVWSNIIGIVFQNLALTRIFATDRPIIILDEPTSALDIESEKVICENIYKYLSEHTIIAITHRRAILEHCSKIYEIKDNIIIEDKTL